MQGASHPLPPFFWEEVTVESIQAAQELILKDTVSLGRSIASLPDEALSFASCIEPLMAPPNYKTNPALCQAKFLQHCSTDRDIRVAAKQAGLAFAKARIGQRMDKGVYERVQHYARHSAEVETLSEYQKHFLNALLADFKRSGLGLEENEQAELVILLEKDAELCGAYGTNLSSDDTRLRFTREQLEGVSSKFLESHVVSEAVEGGRDIEITLKYPDILPVLNSCVVAETRKQLTIVRGTVYGNNLELLAEAILTRQKLAKLLGYEHYAGKRAPHSTYVHWSDLGGN